MAFSRAGRSQKLRIERHRAQLTMAAVSITLGLCSVRPLIAQGATDCDAGGKDARHSGIKLPSGQFNDFWGGRITIRCPAKSPPVDTSKGSAIHKLVSIESDESYYNLAPSDTSLHRSAISYVRGHEITVDFEEQRVTNIAVEGKVAGVYLEPSADSAHTRNARPGRARPPSRPPTRPL